MSPKVFISHASEDKERFVIKFAERLRSSGIDAWVDKWEMYPGDTLADKIFDEGIKNATAVIVILSSYSINKPWVKEELNAAFVKRINTGSKLIPVVIDKCTIPEVLNTTLWEKIIDLNSYDSSFDRIIASIFGTTDKPPLGSAPNYVNSLIHNIGNLTKIDSFVFFHSCKKYIQDGNFLVTPSTIFFEGSETQVPEAELIDSLEVLDENGYIKLSKHFGPGPYPYQITTYGFEKYAAEAIPHYSSIVNNVISAIVNDGLKTNIEISAKLGQNIVVINHILDVLFNKSLIKLSKALGGESYIFDIATSLKRSLNGS